MPRKIREPGPTFAKLREAPRSAVSAPEQTSRWDPVTSLPEWRITREARALLTSRLRPIAEGISAIILEKLSQNPIRTRELVLCAFSDPEEDWKEVLFQVGVAASPEEALAFWDQVGDAIDEWKNSLSAQDADLLCERFSVDVIWW